MPESEAPSDARSARVEPRPERDPSRTWVIIIVLGVAALAAVTLADVGASAGNPPPAYEVAPLPAGLDSLTSLEDAAKLVEECTVDCSGIVYFWSRRMPLSRSGIIEILRATQTLGMRLTLVGSEELYEYASALPKALGASPSLASSGRRSVDPGLGVGVIPVAEALLATGALAHAPAVVVYEQGEVLGSAILGYKTAEAYKRMIGGRMPVTTDSSHTGYLPSLFATLLAPSDVGRLLVDYEAVGTPGAYFRWVPGRHAIAYESGRQIYLLDLVDGRSRLASGYVDFVPTPDGRYFVTPGPRRSGLSFYDADEVFNAAQANTSEGVAPLFVDPRMQDQYPSVGILEQEESRTVYRVLTSWFEGIVYRDYEVQHDPATSASRVRPIGEPVTPCSEMSLSTPIMSQDGTEVAARDESTGTTKIFRFLTAGRCDVVVDLGIPTGKVAWHRTGRLLTFARPRTRRRGGRNADEGAPGIFLFDRNRQRLSRLGDSEGASPLAFPDFVGDDSVVFLIPSLSRGRSGVFRVVEGI